MVWTENRLEWLQETIRRHSANELAEKIREARLHARGYGGETRLSHDEVVRRMGESSRQHLIKLEQGKHRPRARTLVRYAEATGYPVDWFLTREARPFRG